MICNLILLANFGLLTNKHIASTYFSKDVSFKINISFKFLKFSEIPPESAAITGNLNLQPLKY